MRTQTWSSYSSYFSLPLQLETKASFVWIPTRPGSRCRERIRCETQIMTIIKITHSTRGFGANIHSFYQSSSCSLIYPTVSTHLHITHLPIHPPHTYSPPINSPPTPLPSTYPPTYPSTYPPIYPSSIHPFFQPPFSPSVYSTTPPYTHTPINLPSVHLNSFIPPYIYPFINNYSSSIL